MSSSFLHINRHRWLFAAGFLLLIFIQVQVLRSVKIGWNLALWDSAISNAILAAGCTLMMFNLRYYLPSRNKYMIIIVWSMMVAGITSAASSYLLRRIFRDNADYLQLLDDSGTIRFWVAVLVISWMAVVSELWYRQQEDVEGHKRKADAERLAKDAELYKLRQQLQPHFLFNSLNSISALAGSQPERARKMIHQLSEFLRGTLRKEEHQWVTLSDELQHLGLYLEIEKVRFGHRLSTEIYNDESAG
ncbi:MAG TPA: histidine kinase, partial [Chitinophagaceae bacterium]